MGTNMPSTTSAVTSCTMVSKLKVTEQLALTFLTVNVVPEFEKSLRTLQLELALAVL